MIIALIHVSRSSYISFFALEVDVIIPEIFILTNGANWPITTEFF
jgi:hypothetical protein